MGCQVRVGGLQSSGADLNGCVGTVTGYVEDADRWHVAFDGCNEAKLFKAANLERLDLAAQPFSAEAHPLSADLAVDGVERGRNSRPRARSCEPPGSSLDVDRGGASSRDPSTGRLRQLLGEWQSANSQWQAAYQVLGERCMLLEAENRQLREVLEVLESGPDMSARFVARLARQNWRLGNEAGQRATVSDPPSDDEGHSSLAKAPPSADDDPSIDTGRDRRPAGVKRLPLKRCVGAPDGDISSVPNLGEESQSADTSDGIGRPTSGRGSRASSASSQGRKRGEESSRRQQDAGESRLQMDGKGDQASSKSDELADQSTMRRRRAAEKRERERREEERLPRTADHPRGWKAKSSRDKEGMWPFFYGMALSGLAIGAMATYAVGRYAMEHGDAFTEL